MLGRVEITNKKWCRHIALSQRACAPSIWQFLDAGCILMAVLQLGGFSPMVTCTLGWPLPLPSEISVGHMVIFTIDSAVVFKHIGTSKTCTVTNYNYTYYIHSILYNVIYIYTYTHSSPSDHFQCPRRMCTTGTPPGWMGDRPLPECQRLGFREEGADSMISHPSILEKQLLSPHQPPKFGWSNTKAGFCLGVFHTKIYKEECTISTNL
jgi:hypothetical protein